MTAQKNRGVVRSAVVGLGLLLLASSALAQATPAAAPSGPMATAIDPSAYIGGIKLHVSDIDAAIKFYETVFRMQRFHSNVGGGGTLQVFMGFPDLQPNGHQVAGAMAEPFIVLMHDPGFTHVTTSMADFFFRVPDVAAARKRASDAGYPVAPTGNTLTDPSGNIMEVTAFRSFRPVAP